ncbi:hypothetical protein PIB30_009334 [Stylosanthes scabra]|uniref:Uncharacterized protein n=1 Tax=Stylosanthes scabra TaxID=79078 RepID=A0ABU6U6W6_9FABA|nr:hypothetical protein [Stylosanthes scabra]
MALVKGLRKYTQFLKSLTKRPPKAMEEIQDRSHDVPSGRVPAPQAIKNTHRGDRNAYCRYHKQNGHDTEDCRDLLKFVERGLKKGKFREYTGRSSDRGDDRRTRHRVSSPDKSAERKDEPKGGCH